MRFLRLLVAIVVLAAPLSALAVEPDEMLKDPALEARAREISREVRCMVCQNQSIDDSEAPLARDLRILVRQRLTAGDTDQQVLDFLVARYGEFVLLKPRFETQTLLLWGLPPAVLIGGVIGLFFWSRAQEKGRREASELSPGEQARVSTLVESGKD